MSIRKQIQSKRGSIALISLLIISGFTLIMVLAISESSVSSYQQQSNSDADRSSYYAAEACLEEAITRIESGTGFTGETLEFSSDLRCVISVSAEGSTGSTGINGQEVFAEEDVVINGTSIQLEGVHANDDLNINGTDISATETATYVDDSSITGTNVTVSGSQVTTQISPSLPTSISTYYDMAVAAGTYYTSDVTLTQAGGNLKVNGSVTPDGSIIYVNNGDIEINTSAFDKTLTLISLNGSVEVNGSDISIAAAEGNLLIYTDGLIYINGSSVTLKGIIRAAGDLEITGSTISVDGYLWGDSVTVNVSSLRIQGIAGAEGSESSSGSEEGVHTISIRVEYLNYEQNYEGIIDITSNGEARNAQLTSWQET